MHLRSKICSILTSLVESLERAITLGLASCSANSGQQNVPSRFFRVGKAASFIRLVLVSDSYHGERCAYSLERYGRKYLYAPYSSTDSGKCPVRSTCGQAWLAPTASARRAAASRAGGPSIEQVQSLERRAIELETALQRFGRI